MPSITHNENMHVFGSFTVHPPKRLFTYFFLIRYYPVLGSILRERSFSFSRLTKRFSLLVTVIAHHLQECWVEFSSSNRIGPCLAVVHFLNNPTLTCQKWTDFRVVFASISINYCVRLLRNQIIVKFTSPPFTASVHSSMTELVNYNYYRSYNYII